MPGAASPRVTVAVLSYDGRHLLEKALPSVAGQRYRDSSVLVVDNGSSDGTAEWLAGSGRRSASSRTSNIGVTAALNVCVAEAAGEFVALLNNDVELEPDCLERLVAALDAHPAAGRPRRSCSTSTTARSSTAPATCSPGPASRAAAGTASPTAASTTGRAADLRRLRRRGSTARGDRARRRLRRGLLRLPRGRRLVAAGTARGLRMPLRAPRRRLPHGQRHAGRGPSDFTLFHIWRNGVWMLAKDLPAALLLRHPPQLLAASSGTSRWPFASGASACSRGLARRAARAAADAREAPRLQAARRATAGARSRIAAR